jgi:hypothetical protein
MTTSVSVQESRILQKALEVKRALKDIFSDTDRVEAAAALSIARSLIAAEPIDLPLEHGPLAQSLSAEQEFQPTV